MSIEYKTMRGIPKPIPSFFTLTWYKHQKSQGIADEIIAEDLLITTITLQKWKYKVGWKKGDGKQYTGRKKLPVTDRIKKLHAQGLDNKEIASVLKISDVTVSNHLYEYSNLPKEKKVLRVTHEMVDQAAENGIGYKTLYSRICTKQWSVEDAVSRPVDVRFRKHS